MSESSPAPPSLSSSDKASELPSIKPDEAYRLTMKFIRNHFEELSKSRTVTWTKDTDGKKVYTVTESTPDSKDFTTLGTNLMRDVLSGKVEATWTLPPAEEGASLSEAGEVWKYRSNTPAIFRLIASNQPDLAIITLADCFSTHDIKLSDQLQSAVDVGVLAMAAKTPLRSIWGNDSKEQPAKPYTTPQPHDEASANLQKFWDLLTEQIVGETPAPTLKSVTPFVRDFGEMTELHNLAKAETSRFYLHNTLRESTHTLDDRNMQVPWALAQLRAAVEKRDEPMGVAGDETNDEERTKEAVREKDDENLPGGHRSGSDSESE